MTGEERVAPAIRWWGVALALVLIVGIVGLFALPPTAPITSSPVEFTTTTAWQPSDDGVLRETAGALLNAFHNSVPKAQVMFDGQTLWVSGYLQSFGRIGEGELYADLSDQPDPFASGERLRCWFSDEAAYMAVLGRTVANGQRCWITGTCRVGEEIAFYDCTDVHVEEA